MLVGLCTRFEPSLSGRCPAFLISFRRFKSQQYFPLQLVDNGWMSFRAHARQLYLLSSSSRRRESSTLDASICLDPGVTRRSGALPPGYFLSRFQRDIQPTIFVSLVRLT